jgi:predicted ArsR family transcriptional regulator
MDAGQLLAPEDSSPLGRSRADVLDMLRAAGGPLGVREVAQQLALHPNTARFHLEGLVAAGLAARETEDRETPGRPRIAYRAVAGNPGGRRYRMLAEMLTSLIAGTMPEPGKAAAEAGREWGAYLTEQPPPYQRPTAAEAVARLTAVMAELGFAPQAAADGGQYQLRLRQCPFREVAEQHEDVICALHLGLIQGALARMRAPVTAGRLDPFVEPSLCVARLTAGNEPG